MTDGKSPTEILVYLDKMVPELEALYKDKEATGLPYASSVTATGPDGRSVPEAHSCGHDMHVACLIGLTSLFTKSPDSWQKTLMAVFQPGEETAQGAQAMIDDSLFKRFPKPDVILGQHVMSLPSGRLDWRTGAGGHKRERHP